MTRSNVISQILTFLGFTFHLPADRAGNFEEAMEILRGYLPAFPKWKKALGRALSLANTDKELRVLVDYCELVKVTEKQSGYELEHLLWKEFRYSIEQGDLHKAMLVFREIKPPVDEPEVNRWARVVWSVGFTLPFGEAWGQIVLAELERIGDKDQGALHELLLKSPTWSDSWESVLLKILKSLDFYSGINFLEKAGVTSLKRVTHIDQIFQHFLSVARTPDELTCLLNSLEPGST